MSRMDQELAEILTGISPVQADSNQSYPAYKRLPGAHS
jgi:hypothetical protein